MKSFFILQTAVIAVASLVSGCSKDVAETVSDKLNTIGAIAPAPQTKTYIDGVDVKWSKNDMIEVISDDNWAELSYTLAEGDGTSSAVFSSSAPYKGDAPVFAFYPASMGIITSSFYFVDLPSQQVYSEGGVANNTLPMYAYGNDRSSLQFKHIAAVLRVSVYDDSPEPASISNITVMSSSVICGKHYFMKGDMGKFYGKISSNTDKKIIYDAKGTKLSSDPLQPTEFNIVLAATNLADLTLRFESTDGRVFTKSKVSAFKAEAGDLIKFPAFDCDLEPVNDLLIKIDGGEWVTWSNLDGTVPTSSVEVKTQNGEIITEGQLMFLANIVRTAKAGTITVDLGGATYESAIFHASFKGVKSIKKFVLPLNVTTIALQAFHNCSNLTDLQMHDGVLTINDQAFNNTRIVPLYIPKTVTNIGNFILRGTDYGNEAFNVDEANQKYKSVDGVLFSKDGKVIYDYPEGDKTRTSYVVPEGVETLYTYSLMEAIYLTEITLPATLKKISAYALQYVKYLNKITCSATVPPVLDRLTYKAPGDPTDTMIPGYYVEEGTPKVVYVPTGTKDAYESAWASLVAVGWSFNDGLQQSYAGATIGGLSENNEYYGESGFWK